MPENESRLVSRLIHELGFPEVTDSQIKSAISDALSLKRQHQKLHKLAMLVDCDPERICLVSQRNATEYGEKINAVYFQNIYNPEFNDLLKRIGMSLENGRAFFDRSNKCWRLREEGAFQLLEMPEFEAMFDCFIDENQLLVAQKERGEVRKLAADPFVFEALEMPASVRVHDIIDVLRAARPQDKIEEKKCYLHNGDQFEQIDLFAGPGGFFETRLPFLALRYSLDHGKPRYALYDPVSVEVFHLTFGNTDSATRQLIAVFAKMFESLNIPVVE